MKTIDDLDFGIPKEIEKYTAHSAEIAIMILNFIQSNKGMNKKNFAKLVGKTPSDITRWTSGSHNFTIQTLSLLEAKTGMQIIRNLSNENRKKHLMGGCFNNYSEKDLYKELMGKYIDLLDEVKKYRSEKLEIKPVKSSMSNLCWSKHDDTLVYFSGKATHSFSTPINQGVVQLNFDKGRRVRGKKESSNVVVKVHEK